MSPVIRKIVAGVALALIALVLIGSLITNHSYVTTPSMYPTIPPGSEIFVSKQKTYQVGEVIEFHANGLTWAHRLIGINADGSYVTKGDNSANSPDAFVPPVTKADVVGRVTHAPRWLGFPALIAHHPSYGLSWLRTELSLDDKIGLVVMLVLGVLFYPMSNSRAMQTARHRRSGDAPDKDEAAD
jgi:signal peptidase I